MTIFAILENLLIGPLKLVFEILFSIANRFMGHPGLAIIVLSLVMNILVLPLYRRADAMQEEARDIDEKLSDGITHIKKTFKGDERMMILQTYYRQNNYSPLSVLNGSVSLLLEIPFFIAAYQFLSHLDILDGVAFGPIQDLGAPDGLLVIGGLTLNVLPILMTLINVCSAAIYLKGFPLKTKIQTYVLALFFLVFLYNSPSCLVFYWTLNNVFSLVKNIFYKLENPKKVLAVLTSVSGVCLLIFALFGYESEFLKRKVFLIAVALLLQLPLILPIIQKKLPDRTASAAEPNKKQFLLGTLFLTVLTGLLIPSTFIAASPQEYVDINYFYHPLWYVASSFSLAAGTFLVWMGVFYWIASPKGKAILDKLVWIICGAALVNYMFFGTDLGIISSTLQYENGLSFSSQEQIFNLFLVVVLSIALYYVDVKYTKMVTPILLVAILALSGMSAINVSTINTSINNIQVENSEETPEFHLSKNGKNVIVFMLDRAMGEYIPYIFAEKPELKEKFDGFTYYSNVLSYGGSTIFASPALMGGYEYTPVEMNKRDTEHLKDKHNEAVKLMPVTFLREGYEVTVFDPPYANYQWTPDLSIFNEYPEIRTYNAEGKFLNVESKDIFINNNIRNFFVFSIMKSLPIFLQETIYNNGNYNQANYQKVNEYLTPQTITNLHEARGVNTNFLKNYSTLKMLSHMTKIVFEEKNTYLFMCNNTTHEPQLLQLPNYTVEEEVDNSAYFQDYKNGINMNEIRLKMDTETRITHYHVNMASLIELGKWFDFMRENDVYDNTRIILVADHGRGLWQIDELLLNDELKTAESFFPLLMVKDFESTGFNISEFFMTNADVPSLAMEGLILNPINPFTGKPITIYEKDAHEQFVIFSDKWKTEENNGFTFEAGQWASVKNNIWEESNWTFYDETTVLKEHAAP